MTSSASAESLDLDAAIIADAATRLAILRRLGDLGMRLAEEVVERAVNSPYHPEPKHEPARAFAAISRAVRLTLVLQERMEAKLIALRKGELALGIKSSANRVRRSAEAAPDDAPDDRPDMSDRSRETLRDRESERFDELLAGPFDDCVAAIRADLGLAPEDDIPTDKVGVESALENVLEKASETSSVYDAPHFGASASTRVTTARPPDSG
jgi:hypothetical protein